MNESTDLENAIKSAWAKVARREGIITFSRGSQKYEQEKMTYHDPVTGEQLTLENIKKLIEELAEYPARYMFPKSLMGKEIGVTGNIPIHNLKMGNTKQLKQIGKHLGDAMTHYVSQTIKPLSEADYFFHFAESISGEGELTGDFPISFSETKNTGAYGKFFEKDVLHLIDPKNIPIGDFSLVGIPVELKTTTGKRGEIEAGTISFHVKNPQAIKDAVILRYLAAYKMILKMRNLMWIKFGEGWSQNNKERRPIEFWGVWSILIVKKVYDALISKRSSKTNPVGYKVTPRKDIAQVNLNKEARWGTYYKIKVRLSSYTKTSDISQDGIHIEDQFYAWEDIYMCKYDILKKIREDEFYRKRLFYTARSVEPVHGFFRASD